MSLRIETNIDAMEVHRQMLASSNTVATSMQRLSSGLRVNSAADDAAGLAISETMKSQISGLAQASRNVQDGISMIQSIDGSLNQVAQILQRARQLAVQWNNGVLNTQDRVAIQDEWTQLSNEIGRIGDETTWNGIPMLDDNTAMVTLQVGANDGDVISFGLAQLMGPNAGDLVRPGTFFALPWLTADLGGFDMHISDVSKARARFGAVENRLQDALAFNQQAQEHLMDANSRIVDVDIAQQMTTLTSAQIRQQAASSMMKSTYFNSMTVLNLLQNAPDAASLSAEVGYGGPIESGSGSSIDGYA